MLENFCLRCLCDTWMNFLSLSFTVCVRASLCHLSFLPLFLLVYFWSSVRTLRQSFSRSENLTSDWTRPVCHTSQVGRGGDRSRSNVVCERDGLGEHVWGGRRTPFSEFCSPVMDSKSNRHITMQRLSRSEHHSLIVYTDDMRTRSLCRV